MREERRWVKRHATIIEDILRKIDWADTSTPWTTSFFAACPDYLYCELRGASSGFITDASDHRAGPLLPLIVIGAACLKAGKSVAVPEPELLEWIKRLAVCIFIEELRRAGAVIVHQAPDPLVPESLVKVTPILPTGQGPIQ